MESVRFTLFDTPIGACAIAWGPSGILGLNLPESGRIVAMRRMQARFQGAEEGVPPPAVAGAMERIAAFLGGAEDDLADIALDDSGLGDFDRGVYRETRAIQAGSTSTYGEIAARLGDPMQARAVGQSLGRNPWPIVVPCHRVTGAHGRMGGFSAPGGRETKRKLLEIEGALAVENLPLFGATD
ncbi:MAG TPA: methylated-DNA--[protein]-cysteine S-methyltransferase [Allosphingosinicella sp.]